MVGIEVSGNCTAVETARLVAMTEKLDAHIDYLGGITGNLRTLCDRLYGEEGEKACGDGPCPVPNGVVGLLDDRLDTIGNAIARLDGQFSRIRNLA